MRRLRQLFSISASLALAACGGGAVGPAPTIAPLVGNGASPIQHFVIIIQENRSFDNIFSGYPNADGATSGVSHTGATIPLSSVTFASYAGGGFIDLDHSHLAFVTAYNGGAMNGFDRELAQSAPGAPGGLPAGALPYARLDQSEAQPYWNMASQYVLADRMFASISGPSFDTHQYLIAGQDNGAIEVPTGAPWGCDAPAGTTVPVLVNGNEVPGPFPCFTYMTLGDELDKARLTWRYYAPTVSEPGYIWSAYDAINKIRFGPDWKSNVISPETQALTDFADNKLANVTWVVPSFANSDHDAAGSATGPQWVSNLINAIGQSPAWSSTAIFVVWDDWGGWYDHVPPPQLDGFGLGFRVPLLVISPYAKHGYVSHVQHEFGSILHFIEANTGVAPLAASDSRADDLSDCFDFTQQPKRFTPFDVRLTAKQIRERTPDISTEPPDNE